MVHQVVFVCIFCRKFSNLKPVDMKQAASGGGSPKARHKTISKDSNGTLRANEAKAVASHLATTQPSNHIRQHSDSKS